MLMLPIQNALSTSVKESHPNHTKYLMALTLGFEGKQGNYVSLTILHSNGTRGNLGSIDCFQIDRKKLSKGLVSLDIG